MTNSWHLIVCITALAALVLATNNADNYLLDRLYCSSSILISLFYLKTISKQKNNEPGI